MAYKSITAEQAKEIIDLEDVVVLDVRTQKEFEDGHIKNAVLLPHDDILNKAQEIIADKNKTIVLYSQSGIRSLQASMDLLSLGYENIFDFGSLTYWKYDIIKKEKKKKLFKPKRSLSNSKKNNPKKQ